MRPQIRKPQPSRRIGGFKPAVAAAWIGLPTAVLALTLVSIQHVTAICEATGRFCPKPGAEPGAPASPAAPSAALSATNATAVPSSQTAEATIVGATLPSSCLTPTTHGLTQSIGATPHKAVVTICRRGTGGATCDDGPFAVGTEVVFALRSDITGSAYVVDIDADGQETRLLPNEWQTARVIAGRTIEIPGPEAGYRTIARTPVGQGCLLVAVAPEHASAADYLARLPRPDAGKGFANVSKSEIDTMQKAAAAPADRGRWGIGARVYRITPRAPS